jgi:glycosyltransferase involved in cell wall biosynthesis
MKACLASYQAVSLLRGGPSTQVQMTARFLSEFGVEPVLFDPWTHRDVSSFDVFHLFAANIGTYHLAREIRARGVPIVVSPIMFSMHSPAFIRNGLRVTRALQKLGRGIWTDYGLMADICGWAGAILPNTRAEADLVIRGLGADQSRVQVIPNGVEDRFLHGDARLFEKRYGLSGFILHVGHIGYERKNVLSLIRALARVDHPAVIIARVIDNPYARRCVEEAAKHKHILLLEGLDHDSELLASAYAACDVFVLPSEFETPGIAALEAGLAGAKIVITPRGGTKEYFEDQAVYIEPGSVDSIREGILTALRAKKTDRLRRHIEQRFLWRRVAEMTAGVYRKLREGTRS